MDGIAWIYRKKYLGIYQFSETLISILVNPIAGAVADKRKRKNILLLTDALSALVCFLASMVAQDSLLLYAIVLANIILAITYSFASTAFKSLVPNVIEADKVLSFNSSVETILQIFSVVSPLLSYYVYTFWGIRVALFVNGVSFLCSFILIWGISEKEIQEIPVEKLTVKESILDLLKDIREGFVFVVAKRELFELLMLSACVNFFLSVYHYLIPFSNIIFSDAGAYSKLLTFAAIGSIVGAFLSKFIPNTRNVLLLVLGLSGLGIAVISLPTFITLPLTLAYMGNFFFTTCLTVYNIHFISRIQSRVEDKYLGRVFSCVFTIAILFMPLGTATITFLPFAVHSLMFAVIGFAILSFSLLTFIVRREA